MADEKAQSKAGIPEVRRGQEMGDGRTNQGNKLEDAEDGTPALSGRRDEASQFFADDSSQKVGTRGETPRDNTPSVPAAIPTGEKLGESGGERAFKERQARAEGTGEK